MIHGVISDGSFFSQITRFLEDSFRVITYDRRGYGNAEKPAAGEGYSVREQAEDAARILCEYAEKPAWVFGNSAGSLIALELERIHPELVRGMVLFEPSFALDEESERILRGWNEELNGYVAEGRIKKALPAFGRVIGKDGSVLSDRSLDALKRTYGNLENFMHGELNEVQRYRPELSALQSINIPVRVVVSEKGRDLMFGRSSVLGAEIIGWRIAEFPGYHNTVAYYPEGCAACLKSILREAGSEC